MICRDIQFVVLCNGGKACPTVIENMLKTGFQDVREIFNDPSADIKARISLKTLDDANELAVQLLKTNRENIKKISVVPIG